MPSVDSEPLKVIKNKVRERDEYRCTKCGMTDDEHFDKYSRRLDVHRVHPGSEYSDEPGVCVTLCRGCHGGEPRRQVGTAPKANRKLSVGVQFYTDGTVVGALNAYLATLPPIELPTKRAVWEVAMQNYLREKGFWPPKDTE